MLIENLHELNFFYIKKILRDYQVGGEENHVDKWGWGRVKEKRKGREERKREGWLDFLPCPLETYLL